MGDFFLILTPIVNIQNVISQGAFGGFIDILHKPPKDKNLTHKEGD
jgi:hypothetical protein